MIPPIKPIDIYNSYLNYKNEINDISRTKESNGRYSASGAGMCIRKHWYGQQDLKRRAKDARSLRLLRLGTVLGQDFDAAIKWWVTESIKAGIPGNDELEFYAEQPISCSRLNLHGHFDLLIVDKERNGFLYDYKTAHSFKFKQLFGRNRLDNSPSNNYEYQLGTYGFMLEEATEESQNYCDRIVHMENIYINKDNSVVKSKVANLEYKDFAQNYWTMVNKHKDDIEPPKFGQWAPTYEWECGKYCDYSEICNSPYKKKV